MSYHPLDKDTISALEAVKKAQTTPPVKPEEKDALAKAEETLAKKGLANDPTRPDQWANRQYALAHLDKLETVQGSTKQGTLAEFAILPTIMFVCYLGLIFYFKSRGGYQVEHLATAPPEEFTGGVTGPVR
jgi:hypothetical protein